MAGPLWIEILGVLRIRSEAELDVRRPAQRRYLLAGERSSRAEPNAD